MSTKISESIGLFLSAFLYFSRVCVLVKEELYKLLIPRCMDSDWRELCGSYEARGKSGARLRHRLQ